MLGTERVDLMPLLRFDGTVWGGYPLLVLGRDVVLPAAEESKGGAPTAGVDWKDPEITSMSRTTLNLQSPMNL